MSRTSDLGSISTRLRRIAQLAREDAERKLTSLAYFIDEYFLREAYARTRKDGTPGVDGQTASDYEENLEENLRDLHERFKSGLYRAPPVRRSWVPKGQGGRRPIGIPTLEDKTLQRAVSMVLEAVYEEDFLDCSYGFRPGRSPHQALSALWEGTMRMDGGVVLEVDIRSFFDRIDHGHLRTFLDRRVRDGVLRRSIDKWLKAGVMDEGTWTQPETGTPQGGVISPILANLYLHEVIDRWFEEEVKPRLRGEAFLIRFADDLVMVFALASDAHRVLDVLPKRLARFGLELAEEKTRLVSFTPPRGPRGSGDDDPPGSFDFLGFTHFWARSRRGRWVVKRKTASRRMSRALRTISDWCARHRHLPVSWQHRALVAKLRGHYSYYGIIGNSRCLGSFHHWVRRTWRRWLDRRSHSAGMNWVRYSLLLEHYPLPRPRIVHSV